MKNFFRKATSIMILNCIFLTINCVKEFEHKEVQRRIKIFALFSTPLEEPWVNVIHNAIKKVEVTLNVQYDYKDHVKLSDYSTVLKSYAVQHNDIIIGDAFFAENIVRDIAKEFPETAFCFGSEYGFEKPNFSNVLLSLL